MRGEKKMKRFLRVGGGQVRHFFSFLNMLDQFSKGFGTCFAALAICKLKTSVDKSIGSRSS